MKLKTSIVSIAFGTVLVALGLLACVEKPSAAPAPPPTPSLLINAAGATFPYPIYSKWFDAYHKLHPDLDFNYQSIGSGGGIRQVLAGTVDFGASDGPMTDDQLSQAKTKILHFPTVLGADVPTYNIPGVTQELNFTPEALAGIYLGKITKWNDPAITGPNPGVKLPGYGHRRCSSVRRQRHNLYLGRLSLQGQRRVEDQGGEEYFGQLASGTWWEG